MKILKTMIVAVFAITFLFLLTISRQARGQNRPGSSVDRIRRDKFRHNGVILDEAPAAVPEAKHAQNTAIKGRLTDSAEEAPTGFDNLTNGFSPQGPPMSTLNKNNVSALSSFNDNRFIYENVETLEDGIGPTYNAQSCRECHQNVVTGGASQVTVQRTGRTVNGEFFASLGGSLIHSRATYPDIVELVADADTTRTFRISPSTLGDGFVEAIANSTLLSIQSNQPANMRGNAVMVPVLEGNGDARIGRFGWKSQHASLESFSVDAYLNEMGITTPLLPEENTASGLFVGWGTEYDPVADPEDDGMDAKAFADFMRATKAPSRGTLTGDTFDGEKLFNSISCNVCHTASITTAPAGTIINGNAMTVPEALGNKIIHPYSDFLLHDIGTSDGIPILPTPEYAITAGQMRTAPLWGLRTRSRLMHDGLTFTLNDAIVRHAGQAAQSANSYTHLTSRQKAQLIKFLKSL